jgi:hypothetical protein
MDVDPALPASGKARGIESILSWRKQQSDRCYTEHHNPKLIHRIRPLDPRQGCQLGTTGFDVAHDFRSGVLRRRDDVRCAFLCHRPSIKWRISVIGSKVPGLCWFGSGTKESSRLSGRSHSAGLLYRPVDTLSRVPLSSADNCPHSCGRTEAWLHNPLAKPRVFRPRTR